MTPNTAPHATNDPKPVFTEQARVGDIKVDRRYQRALSEAWISQFFAQGKYPPRETYDRRAIGIPSISLRPNGDLYVLDGQHRIKLVERMEGPDTLLWCAVYGDLSLQQEAALCRLMNRNRQQRPPDRYRIALAAGEAEALTVQSELRRAGYYAEGDDSGPHHGLVVLRFTAALTRMMRSAKQLGFRRIVNIVKNAWPDDPNATDARVWSGVHAFMAHYHPDVDFDGRFIDKLKTHASLYYVQQAGATSGSNAFSMAVARIMLRTYNTRQTPKYRLPGWEETTGLRGPNQNQNQNQEQSE